MAKVVINGRASVHVGAIGLKETINVNKASGGRQSRMNSCTYPDAVVLSQTTASSSTVIINGNPAYNQSTEFSVSRCDVGDGISEEAVEKSQQKAEFVTYSANVFIEGKPAVRQDDVIFLDSDMARLAPERSFKIV